MTCPACMGRSRSGRKYCRECHPPEPVTPPKKTILFIRTPKNEAEKARMDGVLDRFLRVKPVYIFSSPKGSAREVARGLVGFFNATSEVTVLDDLAPPKGKLHRKAVRALVEDKNDVALYIFVTHQPHCELALEEFSRLVADRENPERRHVAPGEVVQIDYTRRIVYLL